jgi:hypothetical protein
MAKRLRNKLKKGRRDKASAYKKAPGPTRHKDQRTRSRKAKFRKINRA